MSATLGEFEQFVLLALLQLGEDSYGVSVRDEIERRTRRKVAFGTVYTTLGRLEDKCFVTSWLADPTPERGGRAKRHFAISPAGKRAVQHSLRALRTMLHGLDRSLELP